MSGSKVQDMVFGFRALASMVWQSGRVRYWYRALGFEGLGLRAGLGLRR